MAAGCGRGKEGDGGGRWQRWMAPCWSGGEFHLQVAFTPIVLVSVLEFRRGKEPRTPKVLRAARPAAPVLAPPHQVTDPSPPPPPAHHVTLSLFPVKLLQRNKILMPETCIQSIHFKKSGHFADCRHILMMSVDSTLSNST